VRLQPDGSGSELPPLGLSFNHPAGGVGD
jgi:hypothetical protein